MKECWIPLTFFSPQIIQGHDIRLFFSPTVSHLSIKTPPCKVKWLKIARAVNFICRELDSRISVNWESWSLVGKAVFGCSVETTNCFVTSPGWCLAIKVLWEGWEGRIAASQWAGVKSHKITTRPLSEGRFSVYPHGFCSLLKIKHR